MSGRSNHQIMGLETIPIWLYLVISQSAEHAHHPLEHIEHMNTLTITLPFSFLHYVLFTQTSKIMHDWEGLCHSCL